eukprot:m.444982 g.444982  ORF g.444982 m.444982 type:complete len:102 (+) comp19173_c0_seq1:138-443(+)
MPITDEEVKEVMRDVMAIVDDKNNLAKVEQEKEALGHDLALVMKAVTKNATDLLLARIPNYGFPATLKGVLNFLDELNRPSLRNDESLSAGRLKLMALLMP